jgi:hypothetical protein
MGADDLRAVLKSVGSGYTKLLILLEFSPISGLPNDPQKAKIKSVLIEMFHPFFFPKKRQTQARYLFKQGPDCVADCTWKGF